jgi:protein-S-isoprenylcysteine O-methyltransferase Ste14
VVLIRDERNSASNDEQTKSVAGPRNQIHAADMAERDSAGVVVPPPLIFLGTLLGGLALDGFAVGSTTAVGADIRYILGGLVSLAGAVAIGLALNLFRRAGTRPEPWQPSCTIVETGLYRFTRNPMYLGMALFYAGVAVMLDSIVSLLLLIPLLFVIQSGVIRREEVYLEQKFGEPYRRYKRRVRRWL